MFIVVFEAHNCLELAYYDIQSELFYSLEEALVFIKNYKDTSNGNCDSFSVYEIKSGKVECIYAE